MTTDTIPDIPIGTRVHAYPGTREGRRLDTITRSRVWLLGDTPVVQVAAYAGAIALTHIDVVPEREPTREQQRREADTLQWVLDQHGTDMSVAAYRTIDDRIDALRLPKAMPPRPALVDEAELALNLAALRATAVAAMTVPGNNAGKWEHECPAPDGEAHSDPCDGLIWARDQFMGDPVAGSIHENVVDYIVAFQPATAIALVDILESLIDLLGSLAEGGHVGRAFVTNLRAQLSGGGDRG